MKLNIRYVEEILRRMFKKIKSNKKSRQRLGLTLIQKVRSLPGCDGFYLVTVHTGGNLETLIFFHIDFSFFVQSVRNM